MQTHGSHWECIDKKVEEFFVTHIEDFLKKSNCIGVDKINDNEVIVLLYPVEEYPIKTITLLVNKSLVSSYPVLDFGIENNFKLKNINIWENEIEAQLTVEYNGINLSFFDTLFHKHKDLYSLDENIDFILNGFVYYCSKFDFEKFNDELVDDEIKLDEDSIIFFPFEDGDIDDYKLITPIKEVEKFDDVYGKVFYKITVSIYKSGDYDLEATLMVNEENLVNNYVPLVGDSINCSLWLTGMISPNKDNK